MKLGGFLLLLSGWGIVIAALALLRGHMVVPFIYAGLAVEILGLVPVFRGHLPDGEGGAWTLTYKSHSHLHSCVYSSRPVCHSRPGSDQHRSRTITQCCACHDNCAMCRCGRDPPVFHLWLCHARIRKCSDLPTGTQRRAPTLLARHTLGFVVVFGRPAVDRSSRPCFTDSPWSGLGPLATRSPMCVYRPVFSPDISRVCTFIPRTRAGRWTNQ